MALRNQNEDPEEVLRRLLRGMNSAAIGIACILLFMVLLDVVNVAFGLHMKSRGSHLPTTWKGCLPGLYILLGWGGMVSILNFVPPIRRFCLRNPLAVIAIVMMLGTLAFALLMAYISAH